MDLITLKNDQLEIKIATLGAELQSIKDNTGKEYLWQGQADIWPRRAPVLFPIVGRLQHNQYALGNQVYSMTQHGFARDREFDVLDKNHQVVTFGLTANQETFEVYPFDFVLKICFTLQNKSLLVTYSVQNRSQQVMPFAIGGHPGFAINYQQDATILKIANPQIIRQLEFTRDNLINQYHSRSIAARLPLKADSFAHDAWVLQSQGFNSYSIASEGIDKVKISTNAPYFGVWSAYPQKGDFVCLEPWWGLADAQDSNGQISHKFGINQLQPLQVFNASWCAKFN